MCLLIENNNIIPKIATEDIICYKVMFTNDDGTLRTPYMGFEMDMDALYTTYMSTISIGTNTTAVEKGFHSFTNIKDAKDFMLLKFSSSFSLNHPRIYQCIIPKGAEYYTGIFKTFKNYNTYNLYPNYTSNKIKIIKLCSIQFLIS